MSKELVKLPRELVKSLDDMRDNYSGYEWMVMAAIMRDQEGKVSHSEVVIRDYAKSSEPRFVQIMQALVNGYEIEETPEDKVRKYYHSLKRDEDWEPDEYQRACGVMITLDLLGIKIEGVNS